jgi:hypothetical protein
METRKINLGGVKMKKKLLVVILFCLGIFATAGAVEVINIDLNVDGDANAWTGYAAYDGGTDVWHAYYSGKGKAMGSQRSANLADYTEPCKPGTYAKQIWIGNNGQDHSWFRDTNQPSPGMLNDGFLRTSAGEANIVLWGRGAYQGKFDIYVYGNADGNFALHRYGVVTGPNHITGGYAGFQEGPAGNYVVYPAVEINEPNYGFDANDPRAGGIFISYTNQISGIQLVSTKRPVAVYNDSNIGASQYDVSYETNARGGETTYFGPDIFAGDVYSPTGYIGYLDASEYMEYDITMNESNEGEYRIRAWVDVSAYDANYLDIYLNGISFGTLAAGLQPTEYVWPTDNWVSANIWAGSSTFKWSMSRAYYFNLAYFEFERLGDINMPDCNAVYKYALNDYSNDLNHDCSVDFKDLKFLTDHWLECYSPDPNDCP